MDNLMDRRVFLTVIAASPFAGLARPHDVAVCKADGFPARCRYLGDDEDGTFACLKGNPKFRDVVDAAVADYLRDGGDRCVVPLGDNCPGISPGIRMEERA